MDVDKEFRESVRSAHEKSLQDIHFTPALQKKIFDRIANRKKHRRRNLYIAATAAACLVLTLGLLSPLAELVGMKTAREAVPPNQVPTGTPNRNTPLTEDEVKALVQPSLDALYRAVPELKEYRIDNVEPHARGAGAAVRLRKADREYALLTIDLQTGVLQTFEHSKPAQADGQQQPETATRQASAFLLHLLGEESHTYQPVADYQANPDRGEGAAVTQVTFQRRVNGQPHSYDSITITVGTDGSVLSYGRIGEKERNTLAALGQAVPELNGYLVESKTPHQDGFNVVMRDSRNSDAKVEISLDGADGTLLGYQVQGGMEQQYSKAPAQLAAEKATAFLQAMLDEDSQNYRLVEEDPVTFQRYVKELPVIEDKISIAVDASGKVRWFQRQEGVTDLALFPEPAPKIPKEQAEQVLADHLKLRYITHFPVKRDPVTHQVIETRPLLEYTPAVSLVTYGRSSSPVWWIDAGTGEMKFRNGSNGIDYDRRGKAEPIPVRSPEKPVTVKTKEEAARLLKNEFGTDVSTLVFREQKGTQGETIYEWVTENGRSIEVITHPRTGRVVQITIPRTTTTQTVAKEDALAEAVRILQKFMDPGDREVVLAQVIEAGPGNGYTTSGDWEFKFFKSHEGIPVLYRDPVQAYNVTVDPATGKANGFLLRQSAMTDSEPADVQAALPDKNDIVPADKAARELLKVLPLQLAYSLRDEDGRLRNTPALVYMPYSGEEYAYKSIHLDAVTGKVVVSP